MLHTHEADSTFRNHPPGTVNLTKSQKIFRLKVGISLLFFEKFSDLSNLKIHENHEEWATLKVSSLS